MKKLIFMLGAPGSGKTTLLTKISNELFGDDRLQYIILSPDRLRNIYVTPEARPDGGFSTDLAHESRIWKIINEAMVYKSSRGELMIVDATHSRTSAISSYRKFYDMGYDIVGVDLTHDVTIEEMLERNKQRFDWHFVPEDSIRTMHERLKTIEIPSWVRIIKKEELLDEFKLEPHNFDDCDSIQVFGDIHGCADELQLMFDACGIDDEKKSAAARGKNTFNVFVGDYFDRGPKIIETFKLLEEFSKNNKCFFIEGNHESPLRYYKQFIKAISSEIKKSIIPKMIANMDDWLRLIRNHDNISQQLQRANSDKERPGGIMNWLLAFKSKEYNQNATILERELKEIEQELDDINPFIPELDSRKFLETISRSSYKDIEKNVLELQKYPVAYSLLKEAVYKFRLPRDLIFDQEYRIHKLKNTSILTCQILFFSDIDYIRVSSFIHKLHPMFYATMNSQKIFISHAGITDTPNILTAEASLIRGVGGYEDVAEVGATFEKNAPDAIQIHGHRNMLNLPIQYTNNGFNLNGDVELGQRSVRIFASGMIETTEVSACPETMDFYRARQIKLAQKFKAKKLTPEEEGRGFIQLFQDHKYIDVKMVQEKTAAINFTRKAFEKGIWDNITTKARGLFIGLSDEHSAPTDLHIVARGFQKFFNLGERHGFELRDIRNLAFPLKMYEKANGFLGLLAVDTRPENPVWFCASKTTTTGSFAVLFQKMIKPGLTPELQEKIKEDNVTLVWEVIDPIKDPHIEKYHHKELVLLGAIKNQLDYEDADLDELQKYVDLMQPIPDVIVRIKRLETIANTFNDFWIKATEADSIDMFDPNGIEGFVVEDSSEERNFFKIKTKWYTFWKRHRSTRDRIAARMKKNHKRTGEYKLTKSDVIKMKQYLHDRDDIIVFNELLKMANKDFELYDSLGIVQIREFIINKRKDKHVDDSN
jgi:predicted kinase